MFVWKKSHVNLMTLALILLLSANLTGCVTAPPFQEMSDARQAIAAAQDAGAEEKSPRLFGMAKSHLEKAKAYISSSNYTLARSNAVMARQRAVEAMRETEQTP